MEELVRLRTLSDSLTDVEFDSFVAALFNTFGKRKIINQSLFHLFNSQRQQNGSNQMLATTTNIISNIIQSRKPQKSNKIAEKSELKISFDKLPSSIIGHCASYLLYAQYNTFQNCSRHIFIACNDPISSRFFGNSAFAKLFNTAQVVNKQLQRANLSLQKFQKCEHFTFDINSYVRSQSTSLCLIPLSAHAKSLTLCHSNPLSMQQFLHNNPWNSEFSNIERLKIWEFQDHFMAPDENGYYDTFRNVLLAFKNIKYLELGKMDLTAPFIDSFEEELPSLNVWNKLEAVCLYKEQAFETRFYNVLLNHTSHQLVSLHVDALVENAQNGFGKLRELCIYNANYAKIKNIVQSAKSLERVHLEIFKLANADDDELEKVLIELFSQDTLESIHIKIDKDFEAVRNAFVKTQFKKREIFRGTLIIKNEIENVSEYMDILGGISEGVADDYMMRMQYVVNDPWEKEGNEVPEVKQKETKWWRKRNDGCKLNGYLAQWIHPCVCQKKLYSKN